ncbi:MAG: SRPBCC family protein [Pseudomonadota bacterium]|nr:SRPBCC family protein [Pseudomonadota bacterium]
MEFDNSFQVPLPPDQAWKTLMDIERIAPSMPGAELTEIVDDKTFKGNVSVRLGPVALTFQGTVTFENVDNAEHKATVKAQGADAKGRGGANADVGFHLEPVDGGSKVEIHTDLQLSGSVAQYGRGAGMIQDLASQIIGQFADNLAKQIEVEQSGTAEAGEPSISLEESPDAPPSSQKAAAPAQVGGMAFKVLWNLVVRSIKGLFIKKN